MNIFSFFLSFFEIPKEISCDFIMLSLRWYRSNGFSAFQHIGISTEY